MHDTTSVKLTKTQRINLQWLAKAVGPVFVTPRKQASYLALRRMGFVEMILRPGALDTPDVGFEITPSGRAAIDRLTRKS